MKADTLMVILKGVGFIGGAILAQLTGSLAQWANSGTWPDRINWILIIALAVLQGCNSMVTFASGAWANWRDERLLKTQNLPAENKPDGAGVPAAPTSP